MEKKARNDAAATSMFKRSGESWLKNNP